MHDSGMLYAYSDFIAVTALILQLPKTIVSALRRGVLVIVLLLRLLQDALQLFVLRFELRVVLQLLLERVVGNTRLAWHSDTLLDRRPAVDLLPPLVQVRELFEVNASEERDVDPGEVGNVRDRVP